MSAGLFDMTNEIHKLKDWLAFPELFRTLKHVLIAAPCCRLSSLHGFNTVDALQLERFFLNRCHSLTQHLQSNSLVGTCHRGLACTATACHTSEK